MTRSHLRPTPMSLLADVLLVLMTSTVLAASSAAQESDLYREEVRSRLLDRINADRAIHGLEPVVVDLHASAIADTYCGAQIEAGTRGHYSIDGLPPYMRYSFAGIEGTVLENVAAWSAREPIPAAMVPELAVKSHVEMISEVPPNDGHRRAILDPHVTHVGLGVGWGGGEVRVAEVFLRRYAEWISADRTVQPGQQLTYRARLLDRVSAIDRITVHFENFPYRLTRERANRLETYGLPPEWLTFEPERRRSHLDVAIRRDEADDPPSFRVSGRTVELDLPFSRGRGVYTIVIWVRTEESRESFAATNLSVIADDPQRQVSAGGR